MTQLKLALVQMDTVLGDVDANLAKHLAWVEAAGQQAADLIVFPELSLTGYRLMDLVPDVARRPRPDDPTFGPLLEASRQLDMVVSFVEEDERHRYYIAAAYLSAGQLVHLHRKVYLPTYGLFEEGRFLDWGDQVQAFDTRFGRVGLLICEDFWHVSPPYLLWLDGAEIMLFVSASPVRGLTEADQLGSAVWVERINQAYASLFTTFVAHTNRVGYEDSLNLGGRATIFDPDGVRLAAGPKEGEGLVVAEIDLGQVRRSRLRLPLLRDERADWVRRQLDRILGLPGSTAWQPPEETDS